MRSVPLLLLLVGLACCAFSYWGLNTLAGRSAFDEVAGIIPLAASPIGLFLLVCAAVLWLKRRRR